MIQFYCGVMINKKCKSMKEKNDSSHYVYFRRIRETIGRKKEIKQNDARSIKKYVYKET